MNVRGLLPLVRIEMKAEFSDPQHSGHSQQIPMKNRLCVHVGVFSTARKLRPDYFPLPVEGLAAKEQAIRTEDLLFAGFC